MTRTRVLFLALALLIGGFVGVVASASSASATYPGHDGRIAFVRANQIYTMTPSGTGVTKLTSTGRNYRPRWSPNGKRMSYVHVVDGKRDIWVMKADGSAKQRVTTTADVTSDGAVWSPNGATLAFAKGADSYFSSTLYTVTSTSPFGTPTQVISSRSTNELCNGDYGGGPVPVDRSLAWAPDGSRIAVFNHDSACPDDAIWMYHPRTGEYRQYAVTGGECCGFLDWSNLFWGPDNRFGYTQVDEGPELEHPDAPSRIVYSGFRSVDGDTGGAPSPSGTYLALTNATSGTAKVYRANADGTGRRLLTTGYQPDWQRRP
jgi:Tol biopolymer transport system component